jgi:hypothetical protein
MSALFEPLSAREKQVLRDILEKALVAGGDLPMPTGITRGKRS